MTQACKVLIPESLDEAVAAFGDGSGVTVVGGGTIVMPEVANRRRSVSKALFLSRAGLAGVRREGGTVTIGAATPLEALIGTTPDPLSTAAQRIGDVEIRGQATLGGNLCAGEGSGAPRGDLQAPLIALGATVKTVGAEGRQEQGVEEFLAAGADGQLVLEIEFAEPLRGAYASMGRRHAHVYTLFCVACAEYADGVRVAVGGAGPTAVRAGSVERALSAGTPAEDAAKLVLDDVDLRDDALASAWYRRKTLPTLVFRALTDLGKGSA